MKLELDLSKHCIQTELKRQHNRAVSDYFRAGKTEQEKIEQCIEATRQALSVLDFGDLRSRYPQLAGGSDAAVRLEKRGTTVQMVVDDTPVASFNSK